MAIRELTDSATKINDDNGRLMAENNALRLEVERLRSAVAEMAAVKPRGLLARWLVDRARRALGE